MWQRHWPHKKRWGCHRQSLAHVPPLNVISALPAGFPSKRFVVSVHLPEHTTVCCTSRTKGMHLPTKSGNQDRNPKMDNDSDALPKGYLSVKNWPCKMVYGTPNPCLWSNRLGGILVFCFLPGDSHVCFHANSFEKSCKSDTYLILIYRHFSPFLCFKTWSFPALLPPQGTPVLRIHFGLFFRQIQNKMKAIGQGTTNSKSM